MVITDVSEQHIRPIFTGQQVQILFEFLTLEDGTDRLSRNVGVELSLYVAYYPKECISELLVALHILND